MDWTWYLFGFKGRINRAKYWLAGLVIICWMLFFVFIYACISVPLGGPRTFNIDLNDIFNLIDPATWRPLTRADIPAAIVHGVGTPLFLWVFLATSVKRLHDRDKSGWWMVPFFAVPGLYNQFADRLPDSYADLPLALASSGLVLWGFIEMYGLNGSRNTNRFGADPLAPPPPRDTRPPWDQQSEIEMVPKAGPPPVWRVKPMA